MKLSEAMMLGSVTVKLVAHNWNSCALGAAANAVGIPVGIQSHGNDRMAWINARWPWLLSDTPNDIPNKLRKHNRDASGPAYCWITLRFDFGVCSGEMTFEQLVDYVRSIEPECGECNQFKCVCQPNCQLLANAVSQESSNEQDATAVHTFGGYTNHIEQSS